MRVQDHAMTKELCLWGTYGKGGAEHCGGRCPEHRFRWVRLADCDTEHLQAILRTQLHIYRTDYPKVIHTILRDRQVKPEKFSQKAHDEFMRSVRLYLA